MKEWKVNSWNLVCGRWRGDSCWNELESKIKFTKVCGVWWERDNYRVRWKLCVHVRKLDDMARDDVDTDLEAAKIIVIFISAGSTSQQTSWMSRREQMFKE